jgi:hypothetical protein
MDGKRSGSADFYKISGLLQLRYWFQKVTNTTYLAGLGTNGLVRDQRYWTDHDAGMPMPD